MNILYGIALALFLPLLAQPAAAQSVPVQPLDRIVAVVDQDVVLQSELDTQVESILRQYANNPAQLPPRDVLERQLLDRLILQKLQVARAESTGVKVSDADVDNALLQIAQQNQMDLSQLRGAIEAQGMDYGRFRQNVGEQVIVQRLRQRIAQTRVNVSDAEVDSLLRNGNLGGGQIHLGHILIGLPDGATPDQVDEAHTKAVQARAAIEGGMDFTAAAIRWSNAENALQGGDLGWRNRNELPPALVDVADRLPDGGVSDPIRGPNGFHIIKRFGTRDSAGAAMVTEYHARHILVKVDELVSADQAHDRIEAIRNRVTSGGEDFATVAKETSGDTTTAGLGGDLGWFADGAYGEAIDAAVHSLQPGGVSEPFRTNAGWHIVQLIDTRQTDQSTQMQRAEARNMLFQRKAEDEYESFLRQIRSEAYIDIRLPGGNGTS